VRLAIHRFEPSGQRGEVTFDLPAGATVLQARISETMGNGEIVLALPDEPTAGTEPVSMLFLWEDHANTAGGDVGGWRHVGSWNFRSGSWQHAFARVATKRARQATT
jgi:hypothetical protein